MLQIDVLPTGHDLLGECPLWDDTTQRLYWIDSQRQWVRRLDPVSGDQQRWLMPQAIGSIALCHSGRLLVALVDQIVRLDPVSGLIEPLAQVQHPADSMRLNDGRCDRNGRFVFGSLVKGRHEPLGALYQLEGRGLRTLDTGICVANSTCFSPDGRWLYFADSLAQQIWRYAYDGDTGDVGPRELFIDTAVLKSGPDGAAVDADGCLWVALVLMGQLACFSADGHLQRLIDTPAPFPTCPCVGGAQFDTLYLTSIRDSGNLLRSDHPEAGALMAIRGTGVRGLAEARFDDTEV